MYSTVSDLSAEVKSLIDTYWRLEKSDDSLIEEIRAIFEQPQHCAIALRGMTFAPTFEQRLGKKRSRFLKEILNRIDPNKYHFV